MSSTAAPRLAAKPAAKPAFRPTPKPARTPAPAPAAKSPGATSLPAYLRQPAQPAAASVNAPASFDSALRAQFQARFQHDISTVRVHPNASDRIASIVPGARAVTIGEDIYFAPGAYDPGSKEGRALLAHELTHVIQQRDASASSSVRTGNNRDRFETEARRNAATVHAGGPLVVRERAPHTGPQPDDTPASPAPQPGAPHADPKSADPDGEYQPGFIAQQILKLFPELQPVLEKGIVEWMKDKVVDAVHTVIDTIMEPIRAIGNFAKDVISGVGEIVDWVKKAALSIAKGDCSVLHEAVDHIEQAVTNLMHRIFDPLIAIGKKIGDFFSGLWDKFGAPIWETVKRFGGAAWQKIQDIASWIWDKAKPVRDWSSRAWNWIKDKLGVGDGPEGQNGLLQWVEAKAEKAWDWLKVKIEPIKKPLMIIGGILIMLSPAGPIILIGLAIGGVIEGVRAIKKYFGPRDGVVSAREILKTVVLPKMISVIKGFSTTLATKANSMLGGIKSAHDAVASAAQAAQDSVFSFLAGLLQFIADRIDDLVQWGNTLVADFLSWVDRVTGGFAGFLDKILNALDAIDGVVHDIMKLTFLLAGKVWNAIPACIRDPFIDFFGLQILGRIAIFQAIAGSPEAWAKTKKDVGDIIKAIFIDFDLIGAMKKTFNLLLRALDVPMELLTAVLGKMVNAWDAIKDKPVDFLKNLLRTIKLAFKSFFKNIVKHLANGITGWLTMQLKGTGVTLPSNWLDLGQVFTFVASILGLSVDHVFERIALKLGEDTARRLRSRFDMLVGAWEWIKLVITGQWSALWDKIKESLSNLGSMLMGIVVDWVVENVVETVAMQLTATADPTGISEVVVFLVDTYRTIKTVVQYMRQILNMMNTMLDSILGIAAGVLQPAADLIESAFDKAMPVVIGFLANLANLGNIAEPLREGLAAIRTRVDGAIDMLIDKGKGVLNFLGGGGPAAKPDDSKLGKEVDWTEEGESHRLWIEDRGGVPVVMMASEPKTVSKQLEGFIDEANKPENKAISADAMKLIAAASTRDTELKPLIDVLARSKPTLGKKGATTAVNAPAAEIKAAEENVEAGQRALVDSIKAVEIKLGLVGGDLGSEKNPIPLNWPKPRLASYPKLYFGPGPFSVKTIIEQRQFEAALGKSTDAEKRIELGNPIVDGKPWEPSKQPIIGYVPNVSGQTLPSGKTIGVAEQWRVQSGMTIKMTDTAESGAGGYKINERITPFGFDSVRDFMQGDHVVERQFGGIDHVDNLWPLNSYKNGNSGNKLKDMKFPSGGQKFVPHIKHVGAGDLTMAEIKKNFRENSPAEPVYFRIVSTLE